MLHRQHLDMSPLCIVLVNVLTVVVVVEMKEMSAMSCVGGEATDGGTKRSLGNNSILALSDSPTVPYTIRTLAIEALTALVARRDATTGALTHLARQTNVLQELGVGKGQYLGLLPTLIRYSLAD